MVIIARLRFVLLCLFFGVVVVVFLDATYKIVASYFFSRIYTCIIFVRL